MRLFLRGMRRRGSSVEEFGIKGCWGEDWNCFGVAAGYGELHTRNIPTDHRYNRISKQTQVQK